jgi:hypothetical protein
MHNRKVIDEVISDKSRLLYIFTVFILIILLLLLLL